MLDHAIPPPESCNHQHDQLLGALSICLRRMEAGDLVAVQELDRRSFNLPWPTSAFHYELFENENSLLWVAVECEVTPATFSQFPVPQHDALESVVARSAARLVGMIVVWLILDEAHIATLAVEPALRRHGIGAELLGVALLDAIERGAALATLEVRVSNLSAQALYAHFAFSEAGRRSRYYRDNNEDALILTTAPFTQEYQAWLAEHGWQKGPFPFVQSAPSPLHLGKG